VIISINMCVVKERYHLEDKGVDWRMGSELILVRFDVKCRVDSVGSG
jgi:hypothetical protein